MTYIMIHPLSVTVVSYAHSKLQQKARKSYARSQGSTSSVGSASLKFQILLDFIITSASEKNPIDVLVEEIICDD